MKYYAVTDDPRELYHYGVMGMKWGQHIFGPEPGLKKSDAYRKAQQKLKTLSAKASNIAKTSSVKVSKVTKTAGAAIKKSAAQASYNHRAKQQDRFNKSVARSEAKIAKMDAKIDRYFENKPIKDAKRQLAISTAKQNMKNAFRAIGSTAAKTSEQISYNVRRKQQEQYNKAVEKANTRNRLADAMRSYDQDQKLYKQAERDRKIEALQEKKADVMADNDLKTLRKSVRVEKNMPKYYQQARTGMLPYGKLSDEQVERLQNRLALEWNTRRLGSTEKPSWREQKKMARREGYLQGITKGTAAAMEEVARAGVQYGIKNLANRKKLDAASEYKAEREKQASRIKNQKTRKEIREDVKQDVYENRAKEGTAMFTKGTAKKLREAEANQRLRQNAIADADAERKFRMEEKHNEAREERKFLMDEKHNAIRNERQNRENEERDERKFLMDEQHNIIRNARQQRENEEREDRALERAGKMAYEYGTTLSPTGKNNNQQKGNKNGKQITDDVEKLAKWYEQKHVLGKTNQDLEAERKAHNQEVAQKRQQTMIANKAKKVQEEAEKARAENAARVEEEMRNARIAAEKREAAQRKKAEDDLWKARAARIEDRQKQEQNARSEALGRELAKMLEKELKDQEKKDNKASKEKIKTTKMYDQNVTYIPNPENQRFLKPRKRQLRSG